MKKNPKKSALVIQTISNVMRKAFTLHVTSQPFQITNNSKQPLYQKRNGKILSFDFVAINYVSYHVNIIVCLHISNFA